jgi:hypothetical protein
MQGMGGGGGGGVLIRLQLVWLEGGNTLQCATS